MMTQCWVSPAELSQALRVTERRVRKRAQDEGWVWKAINKRGDRRYSVESLPADIRAAFLYNKVANDVPSEIDPKLIPARQDLDASEVRALIEKYESAPEWSRRRARARSEIISAFAWVSDQAASLTTAKNDFLRRYNAGNNGLGIPHDVYDLIPRLSRPSLDRWRSHLKTYGLAGLLDSTRTRDRYAGLTDEQKTYIIQLKKQKIHRRPIRILQYLRNRFDDVPSEATVRRFIREWEQENAELVCYLRNPDKWRSRYQVAFGNESKKAQYFLHMVEFDNTPADVMCSDGRRYTIVGGIDIFSRKAKVLVVPTGRAQAIATLMRRIIMSWGLFDVMIADNGQDYASRHVATACGAMGIELKAMAPFSPEKKPHIERFFGTLSTSLLEELDGYIGHSVADRKDIEAQKSFAQRLFGKGEVIEVGVPAGELQAIIDTWIDEIYHRGRHDSIAMSPEAKMGSCGRPVRRVLDERVLDILLAPEGTRTVQKKGLSLAGGIYADIALAEHVGERVKVRVDPADASRIYVFDMQFRYICTARDLSLEGLTVEEVERARRRQKRRILEQARALKALAQGVGDPMRELLEAKRTSSGRVIGFQTQEPFENEAMREAARAFEAAASRETFEADAPDEPDGKVVRMPSAAPIFESKLDRYKWLRRQEQIRPLSEREQGWCEGYEDTEEYYQIFVMPYE